MHKYDIDTFSKTCCHQKESTYSETRFNFQCAVPEDL